MPKKRNLCDNISLQISNGLSELFYRIGITVATHPWNTIICSILLVICCIVGLLAFHKEKNPLKLWIPQDSKFIEDTEWLTESFEEGYRKQTMLIVDEDVLRPEVLQKVAALSKKVMSITATLRNGTEIRWKDVCFRVPIIADLQKSPSHQQRTKRQSFDFDDDLFDEESTVRPIVKTANKPFNPSVDLNPTVYCGIIENLPNGCLLENLLEIWNFDEQIIGNLTKDDILNAINSTTISPYSGHESNFVRLLGGTKRNSSGHIVAATALMSHWFVYLNFSNVDHENAGNAAGTEDWASEEALSWEGSLLETLGRRELFDNETKLFYEAARSFGDISSATMFQDMDKLMISGVIMFTFLQLVLSKFNWLEFRLILGTMSLLSIGMAFVSAVGICSVMGVSYGPVHTSLPFLMMGLGVDDIFVMMACWRQIEAKYHQHSIPEKMALMLQHAGASITVTSFTDVVAFSIGASTMLPSLQSFCIYAAVGVFFTYIFAITFVVAVFTLDQQRIEQSRNPIFPCIVRKDVSREPVCNPRAGHRILKSAFNVILTKPCKVIVITTVIALTTFSTHNLFQLKQKFDPSWFIPATTYLHSYLANQHKYYPDAGLECGIFMGRLNYTEELPKICEVTELLKNRTDLVYDVDSWIDPFREFVEVNFKKDACDGVLTDAEFGLYLSKFLFSNSGGKYQGNFKFDRKLKCGQPIPQPKISSIPFRYRIFVERNEYVPAMHAIEDLLAQTNFSSGDGVSTVWGKVYANWITDEVIDVELIRNITLALVSVMVCTLILIANIPICFYIFVTVLLTLINVCGFMHVWGLTIDLVSCIALQLAVGLCVDYAAHIGHTFMKLNGTRMERALETVLQIGEAVFAGGSSTILSLLMLAISDAYIFQAFFKIFMLVIIFGLFHGLVFLPVILSTIGPQPYEIDQTTADEIASYKRKAHVTSMDDDVNEMTTLQHQNGSSNGTNFSIKM
ncbi:hypothetical protein HA402_015564 [Bradysia odoriphaga]|nr:hypothetical protein HA402_015564 [Bradysia odoriphaga]